MPRDTTPGSLLSMHAIGKSYPGVVALRAVDFDVRRGEAHALIGQNGAGKSTLVRILTGAERADQGAIAIEGSASASLDRGFESPREALACGVAAIHQELTRVPELSVAENFFLGRLPRRWFGVDWRAMERRTRASLCDFGLDLDVRAPIGSFPVAVQQLVLIARAIDLRARLLVLDEPTASLDAREVASLFEHLARLKRTGVSLVFIGHRLDEVVRIADRITVLRNGACVGTFARGEVQLVDLVRHMLGREMCAAGTRASTARPAVNEPGSTGDRAFDVHAAPVVLAAQSIVLRARGIAQRGVLEACDVELRAGETLALAGLLGAGRTELAELLFGARARDAGTVEVAGEALRAGSMRDAVGHGIAHCPEERKRDALVLELSVRENIALVVDRRFGRMSPSAQRELAESLVARLGIRCPDVEQPVRELSGGNQQKVVLARWLAARPAVLILDEPTRGIDVGAKAEIEREIERLRAEGLALLFISSELDEVLRLADRVAVLHARAIVATFEARSADEGRSDENAPIAQRFEASRVIAAMAGEVAPTVRGRGTA